MASIEGSLTEDQQRELGSLLWRYRSLLGRVEFLLEAQLMFASSGRDNRLAVIADLIDETATAIGELDLRRELLLHGIVDVTTRGPGISLTLLADTVDEPWSSMFREQQQWFEQTVKRIQVLTDQSRHSMASTMSLIDQLVNAESPSAANGYDRHGHAQRSSTPAVLFDSRA